MTTTSPGKQVAASRRAVLHWLRRGAGVLILLAVIPVGGLSYLSLRPQRWWSARDRAR